MQNLGRSWLDVLAATFILASAFCLSLYRERPQLRYLGVSLFAFTGGVLTKETVAAFLPGALLLLGDRTGPVGASAANCANIQRPDILDIRKLIIFTAGMVVAVLVFVLLREHAFLSQSNRVAITIRSITSDWTYSFFVALRTIGFYFKKFIVPYPLNFAIVEIDPLYEIAAVPLVGLSLYIATRSTTASRFFVAGMFLIAPALVISFGQIAWTPYAERYLYIPAAFIIIAGAVFLQSQKLSLPPRAGMGVLTVLLLVLFLSVLNRSMVWMNDETLLADTARKSPASQDAQYTYGRILAENGDYRNAQTYLERARALPALEYDERIDLAMVYVYSKQGRIDDAIAVASESLRRTRSQSGDMLSNLILLLEDKKADAGNRRERQQLEQSIDLHTKRLLALDADPRITFHLGAEAAARGEYRKAMRLYQAAYDKMDERDEYKKYALRQIRFASRRMS